MRTITNKLHEDYEHNFWDFKGILKTGAHTIGKYPATMVADMQYELLKLVSTEYKEKITVLDPFCGSGTSLLVSMQMKLNSIGIDINPYAVLLTKVKTTVYNKIEIDNSITKIKKNLERNYLVKNHYFVNIEKWFREDVITELSKIRMCISKESNLLNRMFFWVCLSEVIFKYSNDRTSTFKLHIKEKSKIDAMKCECINSFIEIVNKNINNLNYTNKSKARVLFGDSKSVMAKMKSETIPIICTSPPYGDNATTVTYGQFSILPLKWIDPQDLECEHELLETFSGIDSVSLGGVRKDHSKNANINTLNEYIERIAPKKQRKVVDFFADYWEIFIEMERVLKPGGFILMTVGNRTVDGVRQPLDKITIEIAKKIGLSKLTEFNRKICSKTTPLILSKRESEKVIRSMEQETVLIFRKRGKNE